MIRKALSAFCCLSLVATAPGARELFAESSATLDLSDRSSQYLWNVDDLIVTATPTLKDAPVAVSVDLQSVSKNIQDMKVSAEMKARAKELLEHRVIPFLGGSQRQPPEVAAALQRFQSKVKDPNANRELLLLELFEGLEGYARKMEETGSRKTELQNNDDVKIIRYTNDFTGRIIKEEQHYKLTPTSRRVEVYVEDPDQRGKTVLDAVIYVYEKDGEPHQKLVWSRRLLEAAKSIRRTFYDRPDLFEELRETKDPVEQARLKASLAHTRHAYEEYRIGDVLAAMDGPDSEKLKHGKFTIAELDELAKHLSDWQGSIQQFYASVQLEDYQKDLLGAIISYFSTKADIPNPLYKKDGADIATMKIEEVQRILNDFEQGSYAGFGRFGDALSNWFNAHLPYRMMDPKNDLPPALGEKVAQMIVYLGYAADAHKRMMEAFHAGRKEERSAAYEELTAYLKQIVVDLQTFELYESSISLEELRDGRSKQKRLREIDRAEATRLISTARYDLFNKQSELAAQHESKLLEDSAAAFATRLHNASSMKLDAEDLHDHIAALIAKAKELRSIYLSIQFRKFLAKPQNLRDYAALHGGGANGEYYGDQVKGGLYQFFLSRLDSETARNKKKFDDLIDKLGNAHSQEEIRAVRDIMMSIFEPLGLSEAPDKEEDDKKSNKLAVAQAWLDGTVRDLKGKLEVFTKVHELDLDIEKYASSDDTPETQDQDKLSRIMGLDWMNSYLNVGGFRHWTGTLSERIFTPKAFKMLGDPAKKAEREEIMALMREQKYDEAIQKIIDMDRESANKAQERAAKAAARQESDQGPAAVANWDVSDLLSKSFASDKLTQARGVLREANNQLQSLRLAYAGGTMVFDFLAMTALTPIAGAGLALGANVIARGLAGGARIARAAEFAADASRMWGVGRTVAAITRPVAGSLEFGARIAVGAAQNLEKGLALPQLRNFISDIPRNSLDMLKASWKFNWQAMKGTGMMGGMIEAGNYALNKETSPYNSVGEAIWKGTLQNAAWGAKGGVMFAFQTPSSAIHSRSLLARGYKYFGNTTGVLNWSADAAAWMGRGIGTRFFGTGAISRWGKAVLSNEQTFHGWVEASIGGIKNTAGRAVLRTGMGLVSSVDNAFKFMIVFEGFQEAAQAASYYGAMHHWGWLDYAGSFTGAVAVTKAAFSIVSLIRGQGAKAWTGLKSAAKWGSASIGSFLISSQRDHKEEKRGTDPRFEASEHLQAVADARRGAQAFGQIAFMLIPQAGYSSSHEVARSRETQAGLSALYKRGGREFNEFMALPANGSAMQTVRVGWRELGLRQPVGDREVEVPATSDTKKDLAEKWLRAEVGADRIDLAALIGMEMMSPTEPGMKGKGTANHQLFWTVDELRAYAEGKKVSPVDRAAREAAKKAGRKYEVPADDKGVVFMIPEMKEAASKVIGEQLAKDKKLAAMILDAKGVLDLAGVKITDAATILSIQERTRAIVLETERDQTTKSLLKKISGKNAQLDAAIQEYGRLRKHMEDVRADLRGRPSFWKRLLARDKIEDKINGEIGRRFIDYAKGITELKADLDRFRAEQKGKGKGISDEEIDQEIGRRYAEFFSKSEIERKIIDNVWQEAVRGRKDITGRVIQELKDKIKTQISLRHTIEWHEELVGSTKGLEGKAKKDRLEAIGQEFVDRINSALNWGYTKNQQGFAMMSLRPVQEKALKAWSQAIIEGDRAKASRIFVFLKASGGKTLLSYVAFIPYLQMRAERSGRKLWFMTSNELLAEQMKADLTAYAGGIPPDFKITSVDEAKFDEAFRIERGEASIGTEYVVAIDEADENFRKPSNSIGDPNGELSEDNPLAKLRLEALDEVLEKAPKMPKGLSDQQREEWFDKTAGEMALAPEFAAKWRQKMKNFKWYWLKKAGSKVSFGWVKDPGTREMRREVKKLDRIAQEEFGRMTGATKDKVDFDVGDLTGAGWLKKGAAYATEGVKFGAKKGWQIISDDGVATFMRNEIKNHLKTINLGEKRSEHIKIELQAGKVTPINYASAMPTLSTEYRVTAQLMALKLREAIRDARGPDDRPVSKAEIDRIAQRPDIQRLLESVPVPTRAEFEGLLSQSAPIEWGDAQVDNPLKNKKIPTENGESMTLKEFFQRLKDSNTDIVLFSGTAGNKVKTFLAGPKMDGKEGMEVQLVNIDGETKMPDRSFITVDGATGQVTIVDPKGSTKAEDWSSNIQSSRFKVNPIGGIAHADPAKIRLMLRLIEKELNHPGLKVDEKTLTLLAPRSMDEYLSLRQAIIDSEFMVKGKLEKIQADEIVAFRPDFVQEGREEYKLDEMTAENNIQALRDGDAKVVLLVPEIGGRGTDMPFKVSGKYKRFLMVSVDVHMTPEVEDRQAKARLGENPGDRIPEGATMEFIDVTSTRSLLDGDEYRAEVKKLVEAFRGQKVKDKLVDLTDFRSKLVADQKALLHSLLPMDKAALDKLVDEKSPEFRDFATRGEVYKLMVELMQEKKQLEANETSGILEASEKLTKKDVQAAQMLAGMGLPVASWTAGFGFTGLMGVATIPVIGWTLPVLPFVSMGVGWAIRNLGNRMIKGEKVPSMSEQLQGWFKRSPSPALAIP